MNQPFTRRAATMVLLGALLALGAGSPAAASSHREAPAITERPKIDNSDFYMFRSYEPGREDFVTFVMCVLPLQDGYAGPNYFKLDPEAVYELHIDNDGNALEDLTFQFRFKNVLKDIALDVGDPGATKRISIPLSQAGPFGAGDTGNLNVEESYSLTMISGDRRTGTKQPVTQLDGNPSFVKPHDDIGRKSIPDYTAYANQYRYDITIPGCPVPGRVFVGQRKDPFLINLGEAFDLINTDPVGPENGEADVLAKNNITAICLELPIACLVDGDPIIGAWSSTSKRQARVLNPKPTIDKKPAVNGGAWTQQSRLGMPLVNELVIGLKDKNGFNASEPKDDAQFLDYVTHPVFPELIEVLFPVVSAPNLFPRQDLIDVFLLGVSGLNRPTGVVGAEMLRLNTGTAPVAKGAQNRLGVIAGDNAGYPNGRRPGDDVVDITLRVAMGALLQPADAPSGSLPYTDGAFLDDSFFEAAFPYLRDPIPGSPN